MYPLVLVVLKCGHRFPEVTDGFGFVAFTERQLCHGVVDTVEIILVFRITEHLVHHLVELGCVVGRAHLSHVHPRFENHLVHGVALDDFLELRRGSLRVVLLHVDLSQDKHGTGAQITIVVKQDAAFQIRNGLVIVLHGDVIIGDGEVHIAHQLLGLLAHPCRPGQQLFNHSHGLRIFFGLDISLDEPHVGHKCDVVVTIFGGHKVEGTLCGDVVVLEEMCLTHDEIRIVDPSHAFTVVELHGVFLHADGGLFEGAVHDRVECHAVLLGAVVIHSQHFGIVVLDGAAKLFFAFL